MPTRTGNRTQGHQTFSGPCKPPEALAALRINLTTLVPCLFCHGRGRRVRLDQGHQPPAARDRANAAAQYHLGVRLRRHAPPMFRPAPRLPARLTDASQTPEEIATGQQLGAEIAAQLVQQIQSHGNARSAGWGGNDAADQRHRDPRLSRFSPRGQCRRARRHRLRRRGVRFEDGGRRLPDDARRGCANSDPAAVDAGGGKSPGAALGVVGLLATANPAGLIISSGMKVYGEASGSSKVEGRAKATAKEIADVLKKRFQEQGWIS